MTLIRAASAGDFEVARELFTEYGRSLDFSLCFQDFEAELERLGEMYAPPGGSLLLAHDEEGRPIGCVALRTWAPGIGEMKRLYVRPPARGTGLGRRLAEEILAEARRLGLTRVCLDTVPSMRAAIALYRSLGFREAAPYRENPIAGTLYFELELTPRD